MEHLRTIHFTLIALSLAALVLASSSNPSDVAKAREQATSIGELIRTWKDGAVQEAAARAVDDYKNSLKHPDASKQKPISAVTSPISAPRVVLITDSSGKKFATTLHLEEPAWIIAGPIRRNEFAFGPVGYGALALTPPKTLRQFAELWDALNKDNEVQFVMALTDSVPQSIYSFGKAEKIGTLQWQADIPKDVPRLEGICSGTLSFAPVFLEGVMPKGGYTIAYEIEPPYPPQPVNQHIRRDVADYIENALLPIPPLLTGHLKFDPQGALIQRFRKDPPVGGSFEHSFPELNKITKNYQQLDIGSFDPILEAEQNRTGESFEAFGIKFPAEATTRWGILVLLGIQLYFWIHLQELARKLKADDPGWEVAFVGMYSSLPSQLIFAISAYILPFCAVAALGIRGLFVGNYAWQYWSLLLVGIGASFSLSLAGWRCSPRRIET